MVNPGHPSRGCATCKLKRIKCDETRPTCKKCASSKRICLGYNGKKPAELHCGNKPLRGQESRLLYPKTECRDLTLCTDIGWTVPRRLYLGSTPSIESFIVSPFPPLGLTQVDNTNRAIQCTIEAMESGFQSLQEPAQTFSARRKMQQKYHFAIHSLRSMISSASGSPVSYAPACMFALYEMAVNLDANDNTWVVHLDGLLAILRRQQPRGSEAWISTLIHALQILERGDNACVALSSVATDTLETASILTDIAKLRLRQLAIDMRKLVGGSERPRKIDMQKFRISLKQVYGDILLIPSHFCRYASDMARALQIEHRTILIIAANLMIESGEFLQSTETYRATREYIRLSRSIEEAADGICASFKHLFSALADGRFGLEQVTSSRATLTVDALLAMWPLFGASVARGISTAQRQWIHAALWRIGKTARIPKALSLATSHEDDARYSDILAGLILVRVSPFANCLRPSAYSRNWGNAHNPLQRTRVED